MRFTLVLMMILFLCSCRDSAQRDKTSEPVIEDAVTEMNGSEPEVQINYDPATVDDSLAAEVAVKLQGLFNKELEIMMAEDRNFRMYKLNMDQDTEEEIFVLFLSPYFCGTGGCNLLLLDDDLELITRFTVTRPPLFIESIYKNGWKVILLRSEGEWRELAFDGKTYPSNPSVASKAPYDAPSGNAAVLFSNEDPYLPAKVYGF